MRQQIAAANWKMNGTLTQWETLLESILKENIALTDDRKVLFAVPYPYLMSATNKCASLKGYAAAAQNCSHKSAGAYTGEVSAEMLASIAVHYCVIGHSERREYFSESNQMLAQKLDLCLSHGITPVFCCGEPLSVREQNGQDAFVHTQLKESLYHLSSDLLSKIIIAYEPIWAIGTGKTATALQAQEMHASIRSALSTQYGKDVADGISILYGGSVKASNATEIFSQPDVDGGLVGGASLQAGEFCSIIRSLK
jgi:triosephosphate isomerase